MEGILKGMIYQFIIKVVFQTTHACAIKNLGLNFYTRRKTCIFYCSLRLNFSRKRHFATKILLAA
jgi:hypothetical protein